MSKELNALLFDQFLIVSLKHGVLAWCVCRIIAHQNRPSFVDVSRDTFAPYVKEVWPPSSSPAPNVALFCFPEDIDANAIMEIRKYIITYL